MRHTLTALTFAGLALALPLHAQSLPQPTGEVVLTVTSAAGSAAFDIDMLRALPQTEIATTTIWTEGEKTFTGVPLAALLDSAGATGAVVRASAINDYTVEIPTDSLTPDAPIVAYLIDGETMSRRDKGPLWVVYPYDSDASFRTEVVYSRSIWQLDRIAVVD